MKLALRIHFYTDGDYWIRNTDNLFDPHCSMYKGAEVQYQHEEERDFSELWFVLTCEGEANACRWAARDLMEALAVNFSVTQTHYWLVKDLYDLVITPKRDFLWSREDIDRFWTIDGNYEGTELYLYIKHEGDVKKR